MTVSEQQTAAALALFSRRLDRAFVLGLEAYAALLPLSPPRAGQVRAVLQRLQRAVTEVLPGDPATYPVEHGLGVHGMVTRGFELVIDPGLRPFCDAAVEVEQLWTDGLGLDHDWSSSRPPGWDHLVAALPVPDLPPDPEAGRDQQPDRGRWWSRRS